MREPLPVLAWARAGADVDELHLARFGRAFRRTSRYVKLAQVGAAACLDGVDRAALEPGRTGVFLGTGLGNIADIVPLAQGILHPGRPWASPMAFAGSVGNAAAFHVARTLDLCGPNVTVSQEELSFEAALLEAALALDAGEVDHALVGGADTRAGSDDEQRARLDAHGVPGELTEGTGWLLVGRPHGGAGRGARGWIDAVWLGAAAALWDGVPDGATVLPGWRVDEAEARPSTPASPRERRLSPVAAAMRIVAVLEGAERVPDGPVVHVQHTPGGLAARVHLRRAWPRSRCAAWRGATRWTR